MKSKDRKAGAYVLDARTAGPHFPGIGRYVRSLAGALALQLEPSERLTLLVDPQLTLPTGRLPTGMVPTVPLVASPFSIGQQWRVPQAVRRLAADVYHSPYYLMPYRTAAPTVLTVYDIIPLRYPEYSSTRSRLLFRLATRLALGSAQRVIAITENARQDFIREFGIRPERIATIPLAADAAFQPQPAPVIEAVRARHQLPERFVLYVGSNKPHKNLTGLVTAWAELVSGRGGDAGSAPTGTLPTGRLPGGDAASGAELVIAGAWDPHYPEARQLADSLGDGRIRWLGQVADADLPGLYAAATVFVFPSLFEGFGLPVIEAMACGTPVICSNVTALPEVAGDAAIQIDPEDTAGLAQALGRVLQDKALQDDLRERGLRRAADYSWERTAAQTLEVYRQL